MRKEFLAVGDAWLLYILTVSRFSVATPVGSQLRGQ